MIQTAEQEVRKHFGKMDASTRANLYPYFEMPSDDPWVRDVLLIYGRYYLRVLEEAMRTDIAEVHLRDELLVLVPDLDSAPPPSIDAVEAALAVQFRERGLYFLGGQTLPYYGPYIWKRIENQVFSVELPDGVQEVTVHFLHGFLMRSWYHFQSYGKGGAAGWAKSGDAEWPDGLYCVWDAWDLDNGMDTLPFQVCLLKHEAQHLFDLQKYPGIASVDLEYRAKLVELIYLTARDQRFLRFLREAQDDPTNPHAQAAYRLMTDFSRRIFAEDYVTDEAQWGQVDYGRIQQTARELLTEMPI